MSVFSFFKRPPPTTLLRPHQLIARQAGASILLIGNTQADKVRTLQAELTTPFGSIAPVFVVTSRPALWMNRSQTMVFACAEHRMTAAVYLELVQKLTTAATSFITEHHIVVVLDNTNFLGKNLADAVLSVRQTNVELVVMRDSLTKASADASVLKLFERIALFRNDPDTLSFLKKHRNIQNTLIWFNAKDAKPGKYWII